MEIICQIIEQGRAGGSPAGLAVSSCEHPAFDPAGRGRRNRKPTVFSSNAVLRGIVPIRVKRNFWCIVPFFWSSVISGACLFPLVGTYDDWCSPSSCICPRPTWGKATAKKLKSNLCSDKRRARLKKCARRFRTHRRVRTNTRMCPYSKTKRTKLFENEK